MENSLGGAAMENVIEQKSFRFAVRIAKLCSYLRKSKREAVFVQSAYALRKEYWR